MAVPFPTGTGTKRRFGSACEWELHKKATKQTCQVVTIDEARDYIRESFVGYRQLLDMKEIELLSELDQLETTNKPELSQVNHDIEKLNEAIASLDNSLGTNTLKGFLEEQKSDFRNLIFNFERSQKFLTEVELKYAEFDAFVDNVIVITPFLSKAQFRSKLEPIMELEPKMGEEWYVVPKDWFSEFSSAINLFLPQPHDNWEFPVSIPINNSGIHRNGQIKNIANCKMLHSKAWDVLLRFNGLSAGSSSINRSTYLNTSTNTVEIPLVPISHKCVVIHNMGLVKQFSIEGDLRAYPSDTYESILNKLSVFTKLYTEHAPLLFTFDRTDEISYDRNTSRYAIIRPCHPRSPLKPHNAIRHLSSLVGTTNSSFLVVIPDTAGAANIQVVSNIPSIQAVAK